MTVFEMITLGLGGLGSALSLYNYFDLRGRVIRKLKVTTEFLYPTWGSEIGAPHLRVTATNTGFRDITVTNLGLELDGGRVITFLDQDLLPSFPDTRVPAKLSDGDIAHRVYPLSNLSEGLRGSGYSGKVYAKPFAIDSTGARHYGRRVLVS